MHLRAVKLLPLLCACFISPCILHPTPHTEFPFLVLWVFDFSPPFLFSHFDSSASHSYHSSVSFSFMRFLFLHSLSTLSKSGSLHGPSMLQFQFLLNLFTVLFILSWSLSFFFLNLHFFPQFLSMLFPIYPLSGTICQSWFIVRILSAISLSLFNYFSCL